MGAEKHPDDKIQSEDSKDNAAQHVSTGPENTEAERYPSVKKDDAIDTAAGREPDPALDQSAAKR